MSNFAAEKVEGLNGRVVNRSNNNANANGGLVYANANNASSNSNTNIGTRLTLRTTASNGRNNRTPAMVTCRRSICERPEPRQQHL